MKSIPNIIFVLVVVALVAFIYLDKPDTTKIKVQNEVHSASGKDYVLTGLQLNKGILEYVNTDGERIYAQGFTIRPCDKYVKVENKYLVKKSTE